MEFWRARSYALVFFVSFFVPMMLFSASVSFGADEDEPSFSTVVESCFSSWVPDGSGWLTPSVVNRLVFNHQVKGDEAAAVAAIHVQFRMHKELNGLSKDDLLKGDKLDAPDERSGDSAHPLTLGRRFKRFSQHLRSVPRTLFTNNAPRLEGMHQGPLGDCWVVSAIGAAVHAQPLRLKEIIVSQPDGSCTVEFRDGRSVRVNPLTDCQIALSSTAGDQGLWISVLEQAFGQLRTELVSKDRGMIGLDAISLGGDACRSIARLTGHDVRKFHIRRKGAKAFRPDLTRRPRLVSNVRNIIATAVAGKHLLCAGTAGKGETAPGISRKHDYAVIGYDPETDTVTVWNPHGNKFEPKGEPGLTNGYTVVDGQFRMPVHDFALVFACLFIETPGG